MLLAAKRAHQRLVTFVFSALMTTGRILLMDNAFVGGPFMRNLIPMAFVATAMPLAVLLAKLDLQKFVINV